MYSEAPSKFRSYDFADHRWLCIKIDDQNLMLDTFYGNWKVGKGGKFEYVLNDFSFMQDLDKFV